jgi:hypothetical protein
VTSFRARLGFGLVAFLALAISPAVRPLKAQLAAPPREAESESSATRAPAAGGLKTVAVVAGQRYDELIKDITFLGTVAGRPEIGQMVEGGIAFFTQGKGLEAIDKTQPWGVIVQTDGFQPLPLGCLPVKNLDDLLTVAANFGMEVRDTGDGIQEIAQPEGQAIYVKEANGWAFIAQSPATLARVPENPQAILNEIVDEYDLGARFSVQNVPEMYRQLIVQAMQAGMQQGMQQKAGESDEEFQARQRLTEAQMDQAKRAIEELDSLTLGWTIDAEQQNARMEVTVQAVPGSKMAKDIAAAADAKTNFAGFYQPDAAATMIFASQSDPQAQDVAQLEATIEAAREQFNTGIDENENIPDEMREDFKAAAQDWFEAFIATAKTGQMDGGAALHASADSLTLVAGALVKEPAKFESGLRKLEAAAKRKHEGFPGIQWNADTHAGVTFHTLTVPVPAEHAGPHKLLGDEAKVAVGIGPEAVYLAVGRDNLDAVKKAIDASAADKGKPVPPFELAVSLGPVAEVMASQAEEGPEKAAAEAIAELLRTEAKGMDHLRVTGSVVPNGLRYRFEAEQGVLKALGKAAAEKQRQAQQASQ